MRFDLAKAGMVRAYVGGLREAQLLSALQQIEAYWRTVFDDMPVTVKAALRADARLRNAMQGALQSANEYVAMVRRLLRENRFDEATQTLVHFQSATVSFQQSMERWDVQSLGMWLASEAVTDALDTVEHVGEWLARLPGRIGDGLKGASDFGKNLLIGGGVLLGIWVLSQAGK